MGTAVWMGTMLATLLMAVTTRSFEAGGRPTDFAVYPAERVNVSAALELDLADATNRFRCAMRWEQGEQLVQATSGSPRFSSPATMALVWASAGFSVCAEQGGPGNLRETGACRLRYLETLVALIQRIPNNAGAAGAQVTASPGTHPLYGPLVTISCPICCSGHLPREGPLPLRRVILRP
ncbi:hypothetical protein T492DRAFT_391790 [Pavlovales sp. CCMP2436]|nr:hypothetical protein T492DRAFT_391790 [Pavlovales sp. CCMP2436]